MAFPVGCAQFAFQDLADRRARQLAAEFDRGKPLRLRGDETVSVNLWGFTRSVMTHLEEGFSRFLREQGKDPGAEYFLPDMVRDAIRSGGARVKVHEVDGPYFGITHSGDRLEVERRLAERGPPWDSVSVGGP